MFRSKFYVNKINKTKIKWIDEIWLEKKMADITQCGIILFTGKLIAVNIRDYNMCTYYNSLYIEFVAVVESR